MQHHDHMGPSEISASGWKNILINVKGQIGEDNVSIVSAGVAFYSFLAIFPAIAALVSIYGLVSDPQQIQDQLSQLSQIVPQQAYEVVQNQLQQIAKTPESTLGWSVAISILFSLWSANKGLKSLFKGVEIAYYSEGNRGFWKENALTLVFTLCAIVLLIFSMVLIVGFPALVQQLGFSPNVENIIRWARWLLLGLLIIFFIGKIYQYAPTKPHSPFNWVLPGAIVATILWLMASWAFSYYVSNFGSFGEMYGSISAVIVMLLWLFLTCFIVLLGAELNSETEKFARESQQSKAAIE